MSLIFIVGLVLKFMKPGIIIGIVAVIVIVGILSYSLTIQEDSDSQEVLDTMSPETEQPVSEGRNLSINLSESIGIEANP